MSTAAPTGSQRFRAARELLLTHRADRENEGARVGEYRDPVYPEPRS